MSADERDELPEQLFCSDCGEPCCGDWRPGGVFVHRPCDHYGITHDGCGGTMYPHFAAIERATGERP